MSRTGFCTSSRKPDPGSFLVTRSSPDLPGSVLNDQRDGGGDDVARLEVGRSEKDCRESSQRTFSMLLLLWLRLLSWLWSGGLGHGGSFDQECGRFRLAPEIKFGQKVVRKIKVVFRFCSCTVGGFLFVDVVVVHVVVAVVVVVGDVRHRCGLKLQRTQTIQKKKKKKENDEKQV